LTEACVFMILAEELFWLMYPVTSCCYCVLNMLSEPLRTIPMLTINPPFIIFVVPAPLAIGLLG